MMAGDNAEQNLKKLLSGARLLGKLRLHLQIVEIRASLLVKWLGKTKNYGSSNLVK